jgi:hypothetical protein
MLRLVVTAGFALGLVAAAPTASADTDMFTSPSGNIGCMMDFDYVRCDINERNWTPPPRPADCAPQTGYGQGITLPVNGRAQFVCGGDSAMGAGWVLPYGQSHAGGGLSCMSETTGMRCNNSDGHGFMLSRESYSLF